MRVKRERPAGAYSPGQALGREACLEVEGALNGWRLFVQDLQDCVRDPVLVDPRCAYSFKIGAGFEAFCGVNLGAKCHHRRLGLVFNTIKGPGFGDNYADVFIPILIEHGLHVCDGRLEHNVEGYGRGCDGNQCDYCDYCENLLHGVSFVFDYH